MAKLNELFVVVSGLLLPQVHPTTEISNQKGVDAIPDLGDC